MLYLQTLAKTVFKKSFDANLKNKVNLYVDSSDVTTLKTEY